MVFASPLLTHEPHQQAESEYHGFRFITMVFVSPLLTHEPDQQAEREYHEAEEAEEEDAEEEKQEQQKKQINNSIRRTETK